MYSTLAGAKDTAKQLHRILNRSGLIFPLAKCQAAVARAGGLQDWHQLSECLKRQNKTRPLFDFWAALIGALPAPCHLPVRSYLRARDRVGLGTQKEPMIAWVRDIVPYCASLETIHRKHSAILMPGSGKGQRLRLDIVSGLLLNIEGKGDFAPRLDPETLTIVLRGDPASLLPGLSGKAEFEDELARLISAGIIQLREADTAIFPPPDRSLQNEIIRRAQSWNIQKEPSIKYLEIDQALAAHLRLQFELDREESGPKAPHQDIDYRGVTLSSRFRVAAEFDSMRAVVDVMGPTVRPCVSSIWCDSHAGAVYSVEIRLGMNRTALADDIHDSFLYATGGFNGLSVSHGENALFFNPEWPEFDSGDGELMASG